MGEIKINIPDQDSNPRPLNLYSGGKPNELLGSLAPAIEPVWSSHLDKNMPILVKVDLSIMKLLARTCTCNLLLMLCNPYNSVKLYRRVSRDRQGLAVLYN